MPYPRANPTDTARLPSDTWHAAVVPAGVRLEMVGDAEAVDVAYRTTSGNLGYRGDGAGITFSVWRAGRKVCEEEAVLGDGLIRLSLGSSAPDKPATIYLPEGMQPVVLSLTAVQGEISPAPDLPRWLAYGDSITQGWIASGPAQGWAAIAARKAGLDLVNLGYAAAGRGEIVSAEHIATLPADIISIAYGASCWTRVPHSVGLVAEGFSAFLDVVRDGHPDVPIVVVSPVLRPDAEDEPNRLGATLADIRGAIESVTRQRIVDGDHTLALVAGESIINADHLGDGIHPDDEGHKRIAATVGKALGLAMRTAEESPSAEAMKAAAKSLAGGRMTRGRGDGDGDRDRGRGRGRGRGQPGTGPGSGGSGDADPEGRPAGRVTVGVGVGSGVGVGGGSRGGGGAGVGDSDGDTARTAGALRLDVMDEVAVVDGEVVVDVVVDDMVDEVADEVADEVVDVYVDAEVDVAEGVGVPVSETGVTDGFDVEDLEITTEVEPEVDVEDLEPASEVDVEDLEPASEPGSPSVVESATETEPDSGPAGRSRVAGEYVYEDYVDYENDVGYSYVVYQEVTTRGDRTGDPAEGLEAEAHDADADAVADTDAEVDGEVKRKGGRKGRGVAAGSSSR